MRFAGPVEACPEPTDDAVEPPAPDTVRRGRPGLHVYGVAVVMVIVAGVHLARIAQLWRHVHYKSFDNVIFDQAVRSYSRLEPPHVPLKGVFAGVGPGFLQLGDHFSPIHALVAPLYWIWDDIRVLFIVQAVLYAVAAAVIWRFTRRLLGTAPAYVVAVCFGVSWGLQSASEVGYHELDWSVPLLALAIERLYAERHRQALVATGMLLLVKEEMGLVVAVLGLLLFLRGHRWWGVACAAGGLVWSAIVIKLVVPAFGGSSQQYWSYYPLGPSPRSAARFVLTHPWRVLEIATSTDEKQQVLLWLLAVAVGASVLSPIALLALPSLALRLLSGTFTYTTVHWQYNAPLMVIMMMAGVDGVARVLGWLPRLRWTRAPLARRVLVWGWATGLLAVAAWGCHTPLFSFSGLTRGSEWRQSAYDRAAFAAVSRIPRGATVEADDALGVLVSSRTRHLVLVDFKRHGSEYVLLGAAPVITWPYENREQVFELRRDYLDNGYEQIWQRDDVWILRRR